jgi:hypothetical protein
VPEIGFDEMVRASPSLSIGYAWEKYHPAPRRHMERCGLGCSRHQHRANEAYHFQ